MTIGARAVMSKPRSYTPAGSVAYRSSTSSFQAAGSGLSLPLSLPAGTVQDEDLIVAAVGTQIYPNGARSAPPGGSSWTAIDSSPVDEVNNGASLGLWIAYRRDLDVAGGEMTWDLTDQELAVWGVMVVQDPHQTTPQDVAGLVDPDSSLNVTITCPQLTTITNNSLIIAVALDIATNQAFTPSGGGPPTKRTEVVSSGVPAFCMGTFVKATAGATGFPSYFRASGNGRGVGGTLAIRTAI